MWQFGRRWHKPRHSRALRITTLGAAALAVAATVAGASSAAAAPAAGYSASFVPDSTAVVPFSSAINPVTDTVYFAGANSAATVPAPPEFELQVMNGSTDAIEATLTLAGAPYATAVDTATNTVYVCDGSQIAVIDGATNTISATIPMPPGITAEGVAVDSTTNTVFVTNGSSNDGSVIFIDGNTNTVTGAFSSGGGLPESVSVDESTDSIWVADYSGSVVEISEATGSIIDSITLTSDPEYVAVNPVTDTVYVSTNAASNALTVIDGATGTITTTLPVVGNLDVTVDPSTDVVFQVGAATFDGVANQGGLVVIDGATNAITDVLSAPAYSPVADPATGVIYSVSSDYTVPGLWVITPSAANGVSPVISGPSADPTAATATVGVPFGVRFGVDDGQPSPTLTETGPLPAGVTLDALNDFALEGTPAPGSAGVYPITVTASNGVAPDYSLPFTLTVTAPLYDPVSPVRVLDTRTGIGGYTQPLNPGEGIQLQITGANGVPATGVTAVVLNVTATDATASSYITVFPVGGEGPPPTASNLNFTAGETIANLVTVPVGVNGAVALYNHSGTVDLIADLEGYYTAAGSAYDSTGPVRILDTRDGTGGYDTPVGPGGTIGLQISGVAGVPSTGVTAVALNVTATDPTASSYVTVYPDGTTRPTASNLNFTPGETIPNLVIVPVGADGEVDFYNHIGSVNLVADLEGYYTSSGTGSEYVALSPVRVLDTRNGTGGYSSAVGPGQTISLQVTGVDGVAGVTAVVLNVTATEPTASSYVTVYPDGTARPTASNLNFTAGETIPNLVVVPVGADGEIDFYNHTGSVELVADLEGYFVN
jgi:DNA-binding beta-propeller fold protein YncE